MSRTHYRPAELISKLREELLNAEVFDALWQVNVMVDA